jgi:leucyl aminopeptidase (aminopeptidase T)
MASPKRTYTHRHGHSGLLKHEAEAVRALHKGRGSSPAVKAASKADEAVKMAQTANKGGMLGKAAEQVEEAMKKEKKVITEAPKEGLKKTPKLAKKTVADLDAVEVAMSNDMSPTKPLAEAKKDAKETYRTAIEEKSGHRIGHTEMDKKKRSAHRAKHPRSPSKSPRGKKAKKEKSERSPRAPTAYNMHMRKCIASKKGWKERGEEYKDVFSACAEEWSK